MLPTFESSPPNKRQPNDMTLKWFEEKCKRATWCCNKSLCLPNKERHNITGKDRITYIKSYLMDPTSLKNWMDHLFPKNINQST